MTGLTRIATFTCRLMHPCFLSIGLLLLAAVVSGDASSMAASVAVVLLLSLLSAIYVRARMSTTGIGLRALEAMTEYLRHHPKDIIVLTLVCGVPSTVVLALIRAPLFSVVMVGVLTVTALLLALVNLRYRASYHLAAVTSLALVSVTLWEATFPAALAVVPLVGWAKYHLGDHTIVQLSVGCGIAAAVSAATFGILSSAGVLPQ